MEGRPMQRHQNRTRPATPLPPAAPDASRPRSRWRPLALACAAPLLLVLLVGAAAPLAAAQDAPPPARPLSRWSSRLEALRPERPMDYFELAEEVADAAAGGGGATTLSERALARQLFGLAGALAAAGAAELGDGGLARSAALALAELADDPVQASRLRTAAMLLDRRGGTTLGPDELERGATDATTALALSEALSHYRRGQGAKVTRLIEDPAVAELIERYGTMLDGGPGRLREDAKAYRGQTRPSLKEAAVTRMLQLEIGLLAGRDRPWSADRLLTSDQPLAEVDPSQLAELLAVDRSRPLWRDGRWVAK